MLIQYSKQQSEPPTEELPTAQPDVVYAHIVPSQETDLGNDHASPNDHAMNEPVVYAELLSKDNDVHPAEMSGDLYTQVQKR